MRRDACWLATAALTALAAGCGGGAPAAPEPTAAVAAPTATPVPAPAPVPEAVPPAPVGRFTTALVLRRTWLRARPGGRRVATIARRTGFGGKRVLGVTGRRGHWLRVLAPELPNGRAGWVRADATRLGATNVSLRVDRSRRRVALRDGERTVFELTVAVGRPGHETPLGRFAVTDKLLMGGPGTTYGCCAVALTGHQESLPASWSGGDRLALHGTSAPESIGAAVSAGCLRARDGDLRRLLRKVPLGAPVFVRD